MANLISDSIPNLVNGVSQQPDALRLATQCEEQINAYSTVVEGLAKRPPSYHMANLGAPPFVDHNIFLHTIHRDQNERYVVVITQGNLRVYDMNGVQKTVHFPAGGGYLPVAGEPSRDVMVAMTVADTTFILNNQRYTQMDLAYKSPTRVPTALITVMGGNYGKTYSIVLDGATIATFTTPLGDSAAHVVQVSTDYIMGQLASQAQAWAVGNPNYVILSLGSLMWIYRANGWDFAIQVNDGYNNQAMKVIKNKVQRFADLPVRAPNGYWVEVAGDQTNKFDNYYLEFPTTGIYDTTGVWKESMASAITTTFNKATMPHTLTRNSDGSFTFAPIDWEKRKVGDDESNPVPSFIGRRIADIFFYRNRLGFLCDENVILSRSGDYFNFWSETATAVLDGDPIDVGTSHTKVSLLKHAIPYQDHLLLFSDQTQFRLTGGDLLTPSTVKVEPASEYSVSPTATPVASGTSIYFAGSLGGNSVIREYYLDVATETNEAVDVTAHVPRYIPGNVVNITGSPDLDLLVVLSGNDPSNLYVYKYYVTGQQKLQSSWSKWNFGPGTRVLEMQFIDTDLYVVVVRDGNMFLERIPCEPGFRTSGLDISLHVDRLVDMPMTSGATYNASADTTTFTVPYSPVWDKFVVVTGGTFNGYRPGTDIDIVSNNGTNQVTVKGDWRSKRLLVGQNFDMLYKFSRILLRTAASGGDATTTIQTGRLQLRRMLLNYTNTGFFKIDVTPTVGSNYTYVFNGRRLGHQDNRPNGPVVDDGTFSFPIHSRNTEVSITLSSNSFLPLAILSAEWSGLYQANTRRV